MEEYVGNSNRQKKERAEQAAQEERVRPQKVVTNDVKIKKKSRFVNALISEEAKNVTSHSFAEVFIPALKKMIVDIVTDGVSMIFYGEKTRRTTGADRISYQRFSDPRGAVRNAPFTSSSSVYDYDKITLETRTEAESVLAAMDDLIGTYGHATVADLYDLVGVSGNYTDSNYGWYNIAEARVSPAIGGGYCLRLPRVMPIEK